MGANQFVDPDLVRGVSIGFVAPTITPELVPMSGSMPNIISLPFGRCPPLHLQAPTWRHLLKLMARLSGTRIEPTVEALAVTRSSQMHLRTVVQFVRTHHASSDWRAVLWFTIDHPVPTSLPNSRKYTNGDVDVLPWSYTLSSLPALLRDGSDTLLSKFYTIPSSAAAALEESRKYIGDSSSGMRKLAKMVETCYPQMVEPGGDEGSERKPDQIILARITNDERPLRRVIKKFHTYTALSHGGAPVPAPGATTSATPINDAREAFLVELASFQLLLRKSVMICEAEARQVEEYQREKERINDEHGTLRGQIEQLKTSLEHEQMLRRRKMEYDFVAEKVNTLPTREELEQTIQSLENDMAAIRAEHDTQNRLIQGQKAALDAIVGNLEALRFMGKDREAAASTDLSPRDTPGPEGAGDTAAAAEGETALPEKMEVEEGEEETVLESEVPGETGAEDDIEMGEVEEPEKSFKGKKKRDEELEEGEASDASSELSEPPGSDD
ncbi:hypothetical protein MVEN_01230900 [Mycena venus]|uniref:Uncharacterized protein n=1 Tax=Mycena venus TaxID=2733690 RepID=A0A8H6Y4S4_9AGAR|nr:hypothetical protein MVEN_01230900 [Mycena venus]